MRTVIVANGPLSANKDLVSILNTAETIIAADGGANHCIELEVMPDVIIGDLDSIDDTAGRTFAEKGIDIQRFPPEKDATDLELALDLAQERGAKEIYLAGVLGGRWDMSLANILLVAQEKYRSLRITLWSSECQIMLNNPGETYLIQGHKGRTISFLPLTGDVAGVTLKGFKYPLDCYTITSGSTLGVSNIVESKLATEYHEKGILLCILLTENHP